MSYQLDAAQPAILRAFQAAKEANPNSTARLSADYVEKSEFRLLLVYLRRYFELFVMYSVLDTTDDRRLSLDEFEDAMPLLERWGVEVENPALEFRNMDHNKGGFLLFDEFAAWAIGYSLAMLEDGAPRLPGGEERQRQLEGAARRRLCRALRVPAAAGLPAPLL